MVAQQRFYSQKKLSEQNFKDFLTQKSFFSSDFFQQNSLISDNEEHLEVREVSRLNPI